MTAAPASPFPCPYSNGNRCEQSEIWRSAEIAVDRVTENWIAERHKREEVEAALRAARQHIAKLERQANKVDVTVSVDDCGRSVIAALRDYNKRFGATGVK